MFWMRVVFWAGVSLAAGSAWAQTADNHYRSYCATCHSANMSGGLGPPLIGYDWKHGGTEEDLVRVIRDGLPRAGMPPFGRVLSEPQIRALVALIRERRGEAQTSASPVQAPPGSAQTPPVAAQTPPVVAQAAAVAGKPKSEEGAGLGSEFTLEKVAEAPGELWSMAFLPDGTLVATQKDGPLWLFKNGQRLGPVKGTPEVWNRQQGGLLGVTPHPDYANNRWLYLTYAHPGGSDGSGAMTRVVRGQLQDLTWTAQQTLYEAPAAFYSAAGVHFGSQLVFLDGYVYFSVGDRGQQQLAQSLAHPQGKIHRLHEDGRVPDDNPFAGDAQALASIWSYGHRNPQGLAVHPATGDLWSAEHGPRGGDEINRVKKGLNYGWPVVTFGINYNGTPISDKTHLPGMEPPQHHWTPSIAVSDIAFYTGAHFPAWRHQLLVGSLARQELRLLRIEEGRVVDDRLLLQGQGRIRDVVDGPDGYPYVVLNNPQGAIYRLVPVRQDDQGKP